MREIRATYRLQLQHGFNLRDARALVPYLSSLGVSHVYCSPVLRARSGSTHGYDVVDPTMLDPALGTDDDWRDLVAALHGSAMGVLLDIVPNHMATGAENPFWDDVLRHGRTSAYANWFDIDWRAPGAEPRGRILLPVLGTRRSRALEAGELVLVFASDEFRVRYYEHSFPIDPATIAPVLDFAIESLRGATNDPGLVTGLEAVRRDVASIPPRRGRSSGLRSARLAASTAVREGLQTLASAAPDVGSALEGAAHAFGAGPDGRPRLAALLQAQAYRLAFWRRAAREVNYRRFFDINELIALRQEDPEVFIATHRKVLEWVQVGAVDGLRVDHVDGLRDPRGYLVRLRNALDALGPSGKRAPIYVEKILSGGGSLPATWPVAGTTGYDFLNDVEAMLLEPRGADAVEHWYRHRMTRVAGFDLAAYAGRRRMLAGGLAVHLVRLRRRLVALARSSERGARLDPGALSVATAELLANLPVYRTYCDGRTPLHCEEDRSAVLEALRLARIGGRAQDEALGFLQEVLLLEGAAVASPELRRDAVRFVERFQQASASVMAKGVEDTAYYTYAPLASRNEVGGEPGADLAGALAILHERNAARAEHWPHTLLAVSTHDTKRSADVRARLDVLSEVPAEWLHRVRSWRRANQASRRKVRGRRAPERALEYLIYQTLVGVWPLRARAPLQDPSCLTALRARIEAYVLKAAREAKEHTSWRDPDPDYEAALVEFVQAILHADESAGFLAQVADMVELIARPGLWNGMSRSITHLAAPGVPDIYQGDELWMFGLVDPDNRRPVAFPERARDLDVLARRWQGGDDARHELLAGLVADPEDGLLKLHVIRSALRARSQAPELFLAGTYDAVPVEGERREHVVAFTRRWGPRIAIAVAPRWTVALLAEAGANAQVEAPLGPGVWRDTRIRVGGVAAGLRLVDALTEMEVPYHRAGSDVSLAVGDVLATLPVALLLGDIE